MIHKDFKHDIIFETHNFNNIIDACKLAFEKSEIISIVGYTGAGKSTALKYFKSKNENVTYLTRKKSMKTKDFYKELLLSINPGANINVNIYTIMNQITYTYRSIDSKSLLVIDESGKLAPSDLEYLHDLRESTSNCLGIIIAGPEYYFDKLKEWKKSNVIGVPEFTRRILGFLWLDKPELSEIRFFCNAYNIKDEKLIKKWFKSCENFGDIVKSITLFWSGIDENDLKLDNF